MNLKVLLGFTSLVMSVSIANANPYGFKVEVALESLLTPSQGWDDNDHIQAVAFGYLPNGCYTLADARVEYLGGNKFSVKQFAHKVTNGLCSYNGEGLLPHMRSRIPFTSEIPIGKLASGGYELAYLKQSSGWGMRYFNVSNSIAPMIDSKLYANVSQEITPDVLNGVDILNVTLKGMLNSACVELDKVEIVKENDVYVLLPILKTVAVACADVLTPFETTLSLGSQAPGNYLIHSRSQNGKSVNHVVRVMR
ncbi:MAG: hypothetical protein KA715_14855 [Xanthomonadaceae bacterium]|nr:hypothetical protein [Xanthomonadaceae bacterium]